MGQVEVQDNKIKKIAMNINLSNNIKQNKKYNCTYPDCHAMFERPWRLERHMRLHVGERPYTCTHPGCTKSYTDSTYLKRHLETHTAIVKIYKCTECTLSCKYLHNLKRHYMIKHKKDKELICQECGLTFNEKHHLNRHSHIHSGPTIYQCDKCPKTFAMRNRLRQHQEIHKKSYPCPVSECSEVFEKWLQLCAHKKAKHETEYKCDKCDKIFSLKIRLDNHIKTHSENRPSILCPYDKCHRTYFYKSNLENHIKVTHLEKKFVCDICSKGLVSKRGLIKHIQSHEKPKKTRPTRVHRKKRKDAGMPKKSILTALVGIDLPQNLETMVMNREILTPAKLDELNSTFKNTV
ncbi:zinc finger protein 525-like isoform X2 [Pseudomyrmex gracilis]|uniref:zinc finger protein 525-like isoform X2 n=1 Tax=Pseudomyrmex gracilis TaxID=219809 RepID=UPI000995126C|nr:zinc finger protein 525-like isoform X2 [Pseudomyrmex gracilis]